MIPRRNISKLLLKLTTNGRSIPEKTIEKDYIISWILIGLTYTKLHDCLLFKGGTALKKFYIKGYRFSEDLDFTMTKEISLEEIKNEFEKAFQKILVLANIPLRLARAEVPHKNTYTLYFNYSGPLGADISKGEIKVDITINEKLLFPAKEKPLLKEYEEYNDLLYDRKIRIYDIHEIFIEKSCSLLDPKRNEPRDVYDLWYLTNPEKIDAEMLVENFKKKAAFKSLKGEGLEESINKKKDKYKKLWDIRLREHLISLPEFEKVYRELKRKLKEAKYF